MFVVINFNGADRHSVTHLKERTAYVAVGRLKAGRNYTEAVLIKFADFHGSIYHLIGIIDDVKLFSKLIGAD